MVDIHKRLRILVLEDCVPEAGIPWSLEYRQAISVVELVRDERREMRSPAFARAGWPLLFKVQRYMQLCAQAGLPGVLQEAVRWWSRLRGAFPLLPITPAFPGGLREHTWSGHATGEPLAPSKHPVLWASPAGSPLPGRMGWKMLWGIAAALLVEGQTKLRVFPLILRNQSLQ